MKILIALNSKDDHYQTDNMLSEDYPDSERVVVADQESLYYALQKDTPDLVISSYQLSWIARPDLMHIVHLHWPGLPIILVKQAIDADSTNLQTTLRQSYQAVVPLLNTPTDTILLFDTQRNVILANQTFFQRSGKRPDEIFGRKLQDFLPRPLAEKSDAYLGQVLDTGKTLRVEDEGLFGWLDTTIFPIVNQQGQMTHAMVYAHDITARKNLENDLRESHATIDALLNAPMDLILLLDREGKILTVNKTFCQRFNVRAEEAHGRNLTDFLPPALAQKRISIVQQVFDTGNIIRYEDKGATGWFDNLVYPILDNQNKVISVAVIARDITDRVQLEETLRRDQRVMLAMANAPNDIFLLLDTAGIILMSNEVLARSLDRQVDELIGVCFWDLLPMPVAEFRRGVFNKVLQTGIAERIEDAGRLGTYDSLVIPITNDQGEIVQVVIQARNITERKQIEVALQESEKRYRTLVETSPFGIAFQDVNGNLVLVNQQFAALFGYAGPEEIYNLKIKGVDLLLTQELIERRETLRSELINGSLRDTAFTARRKDGSLFQLEANGSTVYDAGGNPMGIIAICRDITERQQMELALLESEKRYRALIEASPDGIFYYDLDDGLEGYHRIMNQQFATLFGYENAEELIRTYSSIYEIIVEQDHPRLRKTIQDGLRDGYVRDVVLTGLRKNGSVFQLEVNGSMVFGPDSKPQGYFGICRDVTERVRVQQELVRAHETLEQRVLERTAELQVLNRQLRKEIYLRKAAEDNWKHQALHSEALARVASRANAHLDINAAMEAICDEVLRAIPFSVCSVSLYREEDDSLHIAGYASKVPVKYYTVPPTPRPQFEDYVRQFGSIITIPDVETFPEAAYLATAATPKIRTLVIMPFYHMGEMVGSLNLASAGEIRLPTDVELDLLHAISDQVALSLTNARLFERISDSQARLKILTERLVEVQEAEKRRLARELHDEIGQMLTSLSLNLEIISRSVQAGDEKSGIQHELEVTKRQIKLLLEEVRDLTLNLLPPMLDDLGLLPALLDHCQRFTSQTGILVDLSHRGLEERVPAQIEVAAYRIVQEALTNVARYAGVNQVDVRLWATPQQLGVQIEDQGAGFDLQKTESAHKSYGIAGMRERAANCGGNLEIETGPGMGVCLTAEFPLTRLDQNQESL